MQTALNVTWYCRCKAPVLLGSEVIYKRLDKQKTKQQPNQGGCQQSMTGCFPSLYSDSANVGGNVIVLWQFSKAMKI